MFLAWVISVTDTTVSNQTKNEMEERKNKVVFSCKIMKVVDFSPLLISCLNKFTCIFDARYPDLLRTLLL